MLKKISAKIKHSWITFTIVLSVLIAYWVLSSLGMFTIPKLRTTDLFLKLRYYLKPIPEANQDIVIVLIGKETYEHYGAKWPWSREVFADLIYKISIANPKVIGVNLGFISESTDSPTSDFLLGEAIKDAGNVILASYFDQEGGYILPYRIFQEAAIGSGFTDKPEDFDNGIRGVKLFETYTLYDEVIDYSFETKV